MEILIKNIKNEKTLRVVDYIRNRYGADPEFLWEHNPGSAAFRNKRTKKWFAALITGLSQKRLGLGVIDDERCDIINLKCDPLFISFIVDNKHFFRGYHMNKQNWISVLIDDAIPFEEITKIIDMSYEIINNNK